MTDKIELSRKYARIIGAGIGIVSAVLSLLLVLRDNRNLGQ